MTLFPPLFFGKSGFFLAFSPGKIYNQGRNAVSRVRKDVFSMKRSLRLLALLLAAAMLLSLGACSLENAAELLPQGTEEEGPAPASPEAPPAEDAVLPEESDPSPPAEEAGLPDPDGTYTSRDEVALYIRTYGQLPQNFITKKEAQALGWPGGSLEPYAPGKCIGGSKFGNYEGLLPDAPGRTWTECDIDTLGADSRGAKRIVFSSDGLIYYTEDHYASFTQLY